MNERIRQLAEQAGQLQLATPDNPSADKIMVLIGPNMEKFAELIIRECALLCDNHGNKVEDERPNKDLSSAAFDCSDIIRDHFGVE